MAGKFVVDISVITISELVQGIGSELSRLVETSVPQNFDDDNAGSEIGILRNQATAPSAVDNDFWDDTTTKKLRHYFGATGQKAWQPPADGISLKNNTGAQREVGDVVGSVAAFNDFEFNADSSSGELIGVVAETIPNGSIGMVKMSGIATVKVSGVVNRGEFLIANTVSGNNQAIAGSFFSSIGVALTVASGGTATARLWVFLNS